MEERFKRQLEKCQSPYFDFYLFHNVYEGNIDAYLCRMEVFMAKTVQTENKMGTEKISQLVLKTGIPLMVSLLINSLYNFVDSVFVSRISEDALTALSLAAPIQLFMSALGLGIAAECRNFQGAGREK